MCGFEVQAAKVSLAPLAGPAKVTVTLGTGLPKASVTVATSGLAKAVLTVALWPDPEVAVSSVVATVMVTVVVPQEEVPFIGGVMVGLPIGLVAVVGGAGPHVVGASRTWPCRRGCRCARWCGEEALGRRRASVSVSDVVLGLVVGLLPY